jgi:protein phosphatase
MKIVEIPDNSLVVLCGSAGCGKSSFAAKHFSPTQVISSDYCRALVSDDEENMSASYRAFKVFRCIIDQRLSLGRLTVADSTALTAGSRRVLIRLGKKHGCQVVLLAFDIPLPLCRKRNLSRTRKVPEKVLALHRRMLDRTLAKIAGEDFDKIYVLNQKEKETAVVEIVPV